MTREVAIQDAGPRVVDVAGGGEKDHGPVVGQSAQVVDRIRCRRRSRCRACRHDGDAAVTEAEVYLPHIRAAVAVRPEVCAQRVPQGAVVAPVVNGVDSR